MASTRPIIKIAVEDWVPWAKLSTDEDGNIVFHGVMRDILDILTERIDFDYELVRPPDGWWGAEQPDGSWSGMMGMVHREEVEFALGPFTVTPQRETVSDFSEPIHNDNQALIMVRPGVESDVAGFLKPFTTEVWLLFLLSLLSISGAMACTVWVEGKVFHDPTKNIASKVFIWVLQTVTQESSEWLPKKDGGRLIVTTWLLASLVFMSSYSGILTAMLTLPRVTIPIDSLADLVAQSGLPWRLEAGAMTLKYLMESEDPVRQKVVTGMSGTFTDCWVARKAIANGEFAAVCHETIIKKVMSWDFSTSGDCHLYMAKKRVYTNAMMAMAFKRNSSYLPRVNKIIRSLRGAGIMDKWLRSQITNTSYCLRPPGANRQDGISPLKFRAFLGTLLVLLAGMVIGGFIFVCEHLSWCVWGHLQADTTEYPRGHTTLSAEACRSLTHILAKVHAATVGQMSLIYAPYGTPAPPDKNSPRNTQTKSSEGIRT